MRLLGPGVVCELLCAQLRPAFTQLQGQCEPCELPLPDLDARPRFQAEDLAEHPTASTSVGAQARGRAQNARVCLGSCTSACHCVRPTQCTFMAVKRQPTASRTFSRPAGGGPPDLQAHGSSWSSTASMALSPVVSMRPPSLM